MKTIVTYILISFQTVFCSPLPVVKTCPIRLKIIKKAVINVATSKNKIKINFNKGVFTQIDETIIENNKKSVKTIKVMQNNFKVEKKSVNGKIIYTFYSF